MSLTSALGNSLSGLRATQAQMEVISGNVSNAGTQGYSRRSAVTVETVNGSGTGGVRIEGIIRLLDSVLQKELRTETSGSGYTAAKASYASQLSNVFGQPGSSSALTSMMGSFTNALQALQSDPSNASARTAALNAAGSLARGINTASRNIQDLRANAESAIGADVTRVNALLKGIAASDARVAATQGKDAGLLDQRDAQINELATLIDVKVTDGPFGTVSLATGAGLRLYDTGSPAQFSFDQRPMSATALYDIDPAKRAVGTITMTDQSGRTVDVLGQGLIRSGEIAALVEMRDKSLVDAQAQLDTLAASLASAASTRQQAGVAVGTSGFEVDTAGLKPGNAITISATVGGVARTISIVSLTSGTLPANATPDPNDLEIGASFTSGPAGALASVQSQLDAAFGAGKFTVSNTGSTLRIVDDGAAGTTDVTGMSAGITATASSGTPGSAALPLFVDAAGGNVAYTGSLDGGVSQRAGFASRIGLNSSLSASDLVVYSPTTPAGDDTRPKALLDALTKAATPFTAVGGVGTTASPYTGTVSDYLNRIVDVQGSNAESAKRLDEGQQVVQASIESRFSETSGVSVDQELANLVQIQNAYSANARIMSAVKEMMDLLMRM
ncbi:flagellar hook-associated protein FlgK [Alsobacter metallidurans]|uniref:Flagellar hook-associated protein 1 n=1 Tax=Alsobacter metallidurans TaxID=340221 RepID=A0A917I9N1_9HYPH|nr:flagellar hook-associated protein FlgK [Alsobacter metallidurans]GGH26578.1 flagellar hook-associated protein FlgK [Alsobacter metallidurans]